MEGQTDDSAAESVGTVGFWEEAEPVDVAPAELWDASWRGAIQAFRRTFWLVAPFTAIMLLPGLALIVFGLGTGYGFALPDLVVEAVAYQAALATSGGVIGGVLALVAALGARAGRDRGGPAWWVAANRPIRLRRTASPGDSSGVVAGRPGLLATAWSAAKHGVKWTFFIFVTVGELFVALLTVIKSLGLGPALRMNANNLSTMPNAVLLGLGGLGVSAVYACVFGAPIGLVVGVIQWFWWKLTGRVTVSGPVPGRWIGGSGRRPGSGISSSSRRGSAFRRRWPYLIGIPMQVGMMAVFGLGAYF